MYRNPKAQVLCLLALALVLTATMAAVYPNQQTEGNMAVIDPDNHLFTLVDDSNNLMPMRLVLGGEVLINDQEATVWDIQPGSRAIVTYENNSDELLATAIHCRQN